jgi:hypothetical protein
MHSTWHVHAYVCPHRAAAVQTRSLLAWTTTRRAWFHRGDKYSAAGATAASRDRFSPSSNESR